MIWFTWRQHRSQALAGLVLVGLAALAFIPYGRAVRDSYARHDIGPCLLRDTGGDHCQSAMNAFMDQFNGIANHLSTWFSPLPGLIGAIVGATVLAREYENGTWRLAWTQAVPRTRWLTVKVLLLAVGIVAVTASLSAVFTWFRSPVDQVSGRFAPGAFDLEGPSLAGYTLFAFAAGVLAGLLLRRTVPAIVAAFAAFMAVRLPVEFWLRQRYQAPITRLLPPTLNHTMGPRAIPTSPGTPRWILGQALVDKAGHPISPVLQNRIDGRTFHSLAEGDAYLRGLGLRLKVVYQPGGRFWAFQVIEASLFTGLAAALIVIAILVLRRRGT